LGRSENGLARARKASRLAIVALSWLGVADALYMLAYHSGLVGSLACPFFGSGCETVGRSAQARHFGVPNAAVGAVGYAAMGTLAAWLGDRPASERPLIALGLAASAASALGASVFLTWEMVARVRAWCFWCLLSAGLNAALFSLAAREGWSARRQGRHHSAPLTRS